MHSNIKLHTYYSTQKEHDANYRRYPRHRNMHLLSNAKDSPYKQTKNAFRSLDSSSMC